VGAHRSGARQPVALALALIVFASGSDAASDERYPTKPVRWIVPYAAGGPTEVLARLVGQKVTGTWGHQVLVDLRPGANSIVGTEIAAHSEPDGYTMVILLPAFVINPYVHTKLPYAGRDFAAVTNVATASYLMLAANALEARTPKELIALAKSSPGRLNYGSGGTASPAHLAMELFTQRAGIAMTHVPYKGGAPALVDLIANRIQVLVNPALSSAVHVKSGRIRALAVTGSERSRIFPELPTVAESGLPGYDVTTWYGLFAPARTPAYVIDLVAKAVRAAVADPQVREQILALDATPVGSSPAEFAAFVAKEDRKWKSVVQTARITPER
jgi:tripartite-type tricarboxylate transporter receptor subunit TctC